MNRQFVVSVVVMFILFTLFGFVVHGTILHADYAKLPNLMRSESDAQGYFPFILVANFLSAVGFTWIYRQGREAKAWLAQGFRFVIAVSILMTIPMFLIYYAVMPFPSDLVAQQIVYETITTILSGIVVAWMNR